VSGVEALLRWQHPERGVVPPSAFIPLAEETGLVVPIAHWALREACRQAQRWPASVTMSVNLSGREFQDPRLVEEVADALRARGLTPARLKAGDHRDGRHAGRGDHDRDPERAARPGRQAGDRRLRDRPFVAGLPQALPRRHAQDRPRLVDGLGRDEQDTAIVRSVIAPARTLGLSVTAEGVETVEQLEELRAVGCDEAQGFHLGRPQPAERLAPLLWQAQAA
jgi:diguanylate cyclase